MVFNDTTTLDGAIQKCEFWLFGRNYGAISSNTSLLKTFTVLLNEALYQATIEILKADGKWQYDDTNYEDLPAATTNLVDSVEFYQLSREHLKVVGVEVLDGNGKYYPITQIDYRNMRQQGFADTEYAVPAGRPIQYDLRGDGIILKPAPSANSVTLTAGLKLFFQRQSQKFEYTDTNKELGIPRGFHNYVVLLACAEYAKANEMTTKAKQLDLEIIKQSDNIKKHLNKRDVDMKKNLRAQYRSPL